LVLGFKPEDGDEDYYRPPTVGALISAAIRLSVCLSYARSPTTVNSGAMEVGPTGQYGPAAAATGSGRNDKEAVAGAALEAFARWLHRRCAPVKLPLAGAKVNRLPRDTLLQRTVHTH